MQNIIKRLAMIHELEVGVDVNDNITVSFRNGYVSDTPFLVGTCGRGKTIEEAAEDYYKKISGSLIVIDGSEGYRKEFYII